MQQFHENAKFNTAWIMSEAHRMTRETREYPNGRCAPRCKPEDMRAYRDEFKRHLAWCWTLAHMDKDAARVSPFDAQIKTVEAEIIAFDMSSRWNLHSPEMAVKKARLADLTTARTEYLEAA